MLEEDVNASEVERVLEERRRLIIADAQAVEGLEPRDCAFDGPEASVAAARVAPLPLRGKAGV